MNNITTFYVETDPSFEAAMDRLYKTTDPREMKSQNPHWRNVIIPLHCGHVVPNFCLQEIFCEGCSNEEGCAECTEKMCVFVCTLCNEAITQVASVHVVVANGTGNWLASVPHPRHVTCNGEGSDTPIVRKRRNESETTMVRQ